MFNFGVVVCLLVINICCASTTIYALSLMVTNFILNRDLQELNAVIVFLRNLLYAVIFLDFMFMIIFTLNN